MSEAPQTKKFQKGERTITPASQQASKYYPAEDEAQPKKVWQIVAPKKQSCRSSVHAVLSKFGD
jgi:large subunit ribosomal protein L6e